MSCRESRGGHHGGDRDARGCPLGGHQCAVHPPGLVVQVVVEVTGCSRSRRGRVPLSSTRLSSPVQRRRVGAEGEAPPPRRWRYGYRRGPPWGGSACAHDDDEHDQGAREESSHEGTTAVVPQLMLLLLRKLFTRLPRPPCRPNAPRSGLGIPRHGAGFPDQNGGWGQEAMPTTGWLRRMPPVEPRRRRRRGEDSQSTPPPVPRPSGWAAATMAR